MCRYRILMATGVAVMLLPDAGWALDLTGKWRFEGAIPGIVQVTQSGNMLSFNLFSGTVSPGSPFATYSVTDAVGRAGISGRIMPSEKMLDGRGVALLPTGDIFVGSVVATRCSCDDGNTANGDGCDAECRVEPCWTCTGDPSVCTPVSDGGACEDGSPCTTGETCSAGACGGSTPVSPCTDMTGQWSVHQEIPDLVSCV
jgi:cysteine-rich repeat protein